MNCEHLQSLLLSTKKSFLMICLESGLHTLESQRMRKTGFGMNCTQVYHAFNFFSQYVTELLPTGTASTLFTPEETKKMPNQTVAVPGSDGDSGIYNLEVFHQLHCLVWPHTLPFNSGWSFSKPNRRMLWGKQCFQNVSLTMLFTIQMAPEMISGKCTTVRLTLYSFNSFPKNQTS